MGDMDNDTEYDMESNARLAKRLCTREAEFGSYDVFLSHRGIDTKTGLAGFLYEALKTAGLHPFLDCISIGEGQDSWTCIEHAIQTTPLALVIFSENFAQSSWCLKELHEMLKSPSIKVLPIFYKVQPCEVSFPEKDQLAAGFMKLKERHGETCVEEWMADMQKASKLNGWEYKVGDKRLEKDFVLEVVGKVFELANKSLPLDVGDHIVGIKQVAKTLIQILEEKKVLMLGLWGMGGIGKSTLARELYNQLVERFDGGCYVEDVAEKVNRGGVPSVQNHILEALCKNKSTIADKSRGKKILEERLSKKQILVVLDDVPDEKEMYYLMSSKMLKEGSMCIVTSRNRRVFENSTSVHLDKVYTHNVQTLSKQDSETLFACHAFRGDSKVPLRYEGLVEEICKGCGGVPLVLKVFGSLLTGEENMKIWEDVVKQLQRGSIMDEKNIFDCLRMSYNALKDEDQKMFLDIACALLGRSVDMAELVWSSQGWSAPLGVRTLQEKALITIKNSQFHMHDHLRDMGRAIAKQERTNEGVCKRLWGSECSALLNKNEPLLDSLQTLSLSRRVGIPLDLFYKKELRILICENCLVLMSSLPENLRWLECIRCDLKPLGHFPRILENNELVILVWMDKWMKRLPKSFGNLTKLEVLELSCQKLVQLPKSFGDLQNLKNLNLAYSGLQSLPQSFGTLSNLEVLNLGDCHKLLGLPNSFGGLQNLKNLSLSNSGIQSLPESFGTLTNLEVLNLKYCDKLMALPDSFGGLQNLKNLDLFNSEIQCLPKSFGTLSNLEVLNLKNCYKLMALPDSFGGLQNLKNLDLFNSQIQCLPESFGTLSNLEVLNLKYCDELMALPDSFGGLQNLKILNLAYSGIQSLPQSFGTLSNLEVLNLKCFVKLMALPDSFRDLQELKKLNIKGSKIRSLPEFVGTLSNLEVLNLGDCDKLKELPNSFGDLQNLKNLIIEGSRIQSLPDSFGKLRNLEVLKLCDCDKLLGLPDSFGYLQSLKNLIIGGSGIQSLPDSFGKLSNLEVLKLCNCKKLLGLPDSFGDLQNLEGLDLQGSGIQSLPESFGRLSNLEVLGLWCCNELEELPDSFGDLESLKNLIIGGSGIQSLPDSFGKLSNLEVLKLCNCKKLLGLPDSFGDLQNLKNFGLQGSGIQSLPESFGRLSNLEVLGLWCCNELEELPDSFGDLESLKNLIIGRSGIQSLPDSFGKLSNLEVLKLCDCDKLLALPDSFGDLQNLKDLYLQGSGVQILPESFGKLNLEELNLQDCTNLVKLLELIGGLPNLKDLDVII